MTETTQNPYADKTKYKYNDLKKLCAERNLDASGTSEELIARLVEADGNPAPDAQADGAGAPEAPKEGETTGDSGENTPPAPAAPKAGETQAPQSAEQLHRSTALRQKAHLDKQGKVSMFVPFEQGENPEQAKLIPMTVTINGHVTEVPRGVMTQVPIDVAQIIQERLESEGRASRESGVNLAASSQDKRDALNA